jgi:hypothetical protein
MVRIATVIAVTDSEAWGRRSGRSLATNRRPTINVDSSALPVIVAMQSKKYEHLLTLKITTEMRNEIDQALVLLEDSFVKTRSEFFRYAAAYALAYLLNKPCYSFDQTFARFDESPE